MPISVKRSGAWVAVPNGKLYVRSGSQWLSPKKVFVKVNGSWWDTGFEGNPNPPSLALYSDDYNRISVTLSPSSAGAPATSLRAALYNQFGTLLQVIDNVPTGVPASFQGLASDTYYIVRGFAFTQTGVMSNPSADLRRRTGHPEQGYQQANYGWGGENMATPVQFDGTSEHEGGGHPGWFSTDNNTTTAWVSGANADPAAFAALVFHVAGGNRLLTRIRMWTLQGSSENPNDVYSPYQTAYCGIWINGNLTYNQPVGAGVVKDWYVEQFNWNLQNVSQFNISMTNLVPWPLAYRAEIAEVVYYYKDWVIVSYTYIVTVNYAANSYW